MRFRFTLSHDSLGSEQINEPGGWDTAKIVLERDPEFYSLIENYEGLGETGAFTFYGEDGANNGGINFIERVEQNYGPDAEVGLLAEFAIDDLNYETLFEGIVNIWDKDKRINNQLDAPVIREDFWTKFTNRLSTPVNLSSTTDIDGNPVSAVPSITIQLPAQKIRFYGEWQWDETGHYPNLSGYLGLQLDWDKEIRKDIKKYTLPRVPADIGSPADRSLMPGNFEAPWDGYYTFDVRIEFATLGVGGTAWTAPGNNAYIGKTGQGSFEALDYATVVYGSDTIAIATYNKTIFLVKGEQVTIMMDSQNPTVTVFGGYVNDWKTDCALATTTSIALNGEQTIDGTLTSNSRVLVKNQADQTQNGIYVSSAGAWSRATDADSNAELQRATVRITGGTVNALTYWRQVQEDIDLGISNITFSFTIYNNTFFRPYPGVGDPDTHVTITADTTYQKSEAEGYLIHDAIFGVLQRLGLGDDPFYSEFLGSTLTNCRQYAADGCGWAYGLFKGLQLRQYSLDDKPFFTSFKQLWDGINPILNLSLMPDTINGDQVIRIEQKAFTFDFSDTSVLFDNIADMPSVYDQNHIFKTIKNGYKKWQSEDVSGIDDPQTKQTRATVIKRAGTDFTIESEFIAASLAIESTRRTTRDKTTDYKFDNDIFIIALNDDDISPDVYIPELDENFDSITGLLNSETRYNSTLTPMRNFLRWGNVFNGCLFQYQTSSYKFGGGEGNYDMQSDYSCSTGRQCIGIICDNLREGQDIPLGSPSFYYGILGYLFIPEEFTFTTELEWEDFQTIRDNPHLAIGVSQGFTDHAKFFIKKLEYSIVEGRATITAWPKIPFRTSVPESLTSDPTC